MTEFIHENLTGIAHSLLTSKLIQVTRHAEQTKNLSNSFAELIILQALLLVQDNPNSYFGEDEKASQLL